jgi:ABC-type transporter Mla MlaB component
MLRPPSGPSAIVLVIGGPIPGSCVPGICERVRVLLEDGDAELVVCDVAALADPDLGIVDALARLQLTARRLGRQVRLRHVSRELRELLALAGLAGVVPAEAGLRVEPRGQTEQREQPGGVEERVDPDDATG